MFKMDCIITVYKWLTRDHAIPVAEIRWTGGFHRSHAHFAKQHGGDFIEIQSLDDYMELADQINYV